MDVCVKVNDMKKLVWWHLFSWILVAAFLLCLHRYSGRPNEQLISSVMFVIIQQICRTEVCILWYVKTRASIERLLCKLPPSRCRKGSWIEWVRPILSGHLKSNSCPNSRSCSRLAWFSVIYTTGAFLRFHFRTQIALACDDGKIKNFVWYQIFELFWD